MNDGGPAFPHHVYKFEDTASKHAIHDGMSLRDWFAGQALVGLAASPRAAGADPQVYTSDAYKLADAMLAARERKESTS